MNYKELIEELRRYEKMLPLDGKAATAIKTLLAEREALMEQIHGECRLCVNVRKCYTDYKTMHDCARNNRRNWQWRGPTPPDRQQTES